MSRAKPKVMKVPRSVRVGGVAVRIKVFKELGEGGDDWGHYLHDEKVIRLGVKCFGCPVKLRETLRHELQHAALSISGVAFMDKFDEEAVVRCFDEIFFPCWDKLCEKYEI